MTGPHPLNQAVIAQALHDLRNGQLRRAKSMGFDDTDLDALKHPAMASVKWFTEFCHLNRGDMLTSEHYRCLNEKKKFQRRV